ncbi:hypothetical protein T4A_7924 [Trichinella pseudospiralis]|uniref:Uncharacterized protein n=1 Tax=Trichinella pseudospiralis TaxID=6337 RepID=A0A0V1EMB6_TRIPS|nr:hypothetical protein T4A_7924 [Trichinella pseudospiralis]
MNNERAICVVTLKKYLHKGKQIQYIAMSAEGMSSTIILLFNTIYCRLPMLYNNVHIILGKTEPSFYRIFIISYHVVNDGKLGRST